MRASARPLFRNSSDTIRRPSRRTTRTLKQRRCGKRRTRYRTCQKLVDPPQMVEFPLFYCPFTLDENVVAGGERIEGAPYSTDESKALVKGVQLALSELSFRAASGESEAIEGLLNIATKATHAVTNLAHNEP